MKKSQEIPKYQKSTVFYADHTIRLLMYIDVLT